MEEKQKRLLTIAVAVLGVALAGSLLTVAYLAGRVRGLSEKDHSTAALTLERPGSEGLIGGRDPNQTTAATPLSSAVSAPFFDAEGIAPTPTAALSPSFATPGGMPAPIQPEIETTAVARNPGSSSTTRQTVAAYFTEVDRADDLGAGDPQAFAQALMKSVSTGDFSGFDDLIGKAGAQRDRFRALAPPPSCVEHHRLALSLANESVAMLQKMRGALVQNDTQTLLAMATQGQTLETKAKQLKAMGDALKQQAGM